MMRPLVSPLAIPDALPPATGYQGFLNRIFPSWARNHWYLKSLRTQVAARGPVTPEHWGEAERFALAHTLERFLLRASGFGDALTFHPDDPLAIVGDCEIGDLAWVASLQEIERQLRVTIDDVEFHELLDRNGTFGQFVDMVQAKINSGRQAQR